MAKNITLDQINRGEGGTASMQTRALHVEGVRAVDAEKRTVELAFSSDAEIERWFGVEVLSHASGAIRLSRLQNRAAVLVNHDWDDQVAVVESVSIGADRKGRAVVRFSRSARGEEIFQDVVDGIRTLVSVGYIVHGFKLIEERDGTDVYEINDWEPYEVSIVSVPADTTVGVGRSANAPEETKPQPENNLPKLETETRKEPQMSKETEGQPQTVDVVAERKAAQDAERARVRAINDMAEKFGKSISGGADALARSAINDGSTPEQFQGVLLDKLNERSNKPLNDQAREADIGMTEAEAERFSILRVVRALLPDASRADREAAAFEFEVCETAKRAAVKEGRQVRGVLIPTDVLRRAVIPAMARTMTTGTSGTPSGATGGYIVANELLAGSFIEMLRNRTTIMRLGMNMGGLVGNVDIPRQKAGGNGYWIGEGQDAGNIDPELGQISLSPKTLAAYTDITRRLLMQSTPDAEGFVRRSLAADMALTLDKAGYYGTGTNYQPRGLKNYSGINGKDFASAGAPTWVELVGMETAIATDNADVPSMAYVGNAKFRGHAKTTQKFPTTPTGATIWEPGNSVNGYRTEITNQIEDADVFFGNFADFIIAMWGGLDIKLDPYALSKSGGLRVLAFQDVDFQLRREESFCWGSADVT